MIGTLIDGEYKVVESIGRGAFGEVYACEEKTLGRRVALKMFSYAVESEREIERFVSEGKSLAALSHPNVVAIHRLGKHNGTPFIIMELIEGRTLLDLMEASRPSLPKGLRIMAQVASGLAAIHKQGIVHRDLKPNNVMVAENDKVKILDLGLAKDIKRLSTITREGQLVGTIAYMAPEIMEGKPATFASDIFSFGVMLYEVMTGQHPFVAEHHSSMLYNMANRDPHPIDQARGFPPELIQIVMECLAKDPVARRFEAADLERRLTEILKTTDLTTVEISQEELPARGARPSNPYLNRAMIQRHRDFYGRRHEIRRIYARLNATPPGSVSIVGDRRIGKSSLLNYIYMRQNRESLLETPDKMVMVFLDLQQEKGMSIESFVKFLLGKAQFELRGRVDISDCPPSLDGVKSLVESIHEKGFRLAILLDEFDTVTTNSNFTLDFFSFLRYLANNFNVAYLTSSVRDLQDLCHTEEISDSPFFNIFSTLRISVFTREEALELVKKPSEREGRSLAPYADRILEMAGLFPFYIQIACSHTFEYMEESGKEPDFDEILRRFYKEAVLHYRFLWSKLDRYEQSALIKVALGKKVPVDLRHALTGLEPRHIVQTEGETVTLFSPTFRDFVREESGKGSRAPLWKRVWSRG